MKIEDIRKMRNRAPFRSFRLHLTNGETIDVGYPESMSIPEDQQDLFVTWDKSGWNLLDASQVARISVSKRSSKH
jgi:hypothetical protein